MEDVLLQHLILISIHLHRLIKQMPMVFLWKTGITISKLLLNSPWLKPMVFISSINNNSFSNSIGLWSADIPYFKIHFHSSSKLNNTSLPMPNLFSKISLYKSKSCEVEKLLLIAFVTSSKAFNFKSWTFFLLNWFVWNAQNYRM